MVCEKELDLLKNVALGAGCTRAVATAKQRKMVGRHGMDQQYLLSHNSLAAAYLPRERRYVA